ncbi:Rne/Rng family ribonuclease, partial [Bifidobacterium breve]
RRRRGSRNESGASNNDSESSENNGDDSRRRRDDRDERDRDDDEEQTVTRRRRRRRGGKNAESGDEQDDQQLTRRSRKQQYIDEITDVEGSTRLEAKKQRRRDNRRERSRQSQLMEQDFLARRENVDRLMVVREKEHHTQISVVEDNILVEHYVSDIQEVQTVGNIYLGRVQNVLPSMEAAFVDIGQARNGVLYAGEVNWDAARLEGQPRRIELAFKSGDPVLVQVTKDPIGHKGARLTSQVTLAGRFLVLVPSGGMTGVSRKLSERERSRLKGIVSKIAPKDMGVIIRTAAEGASEEAIVKDLESLVRQWERINAKREEFWHGKRPKLLQGEPDVAIRVVRDIFNDDFGKLIVEGDKVYGRIEEYLDTMAPDLKDKLEKWDPAEHEGKDVFDKWQIDSQLRKGMERQVYLPSGGSIVIDRTEAMTTIDVNTGRFIGKGKSLEETVTRCNLEASEEIARQLRLRDIGGMVMIDYVDMVMPANRDLVLRRLVECLARDRTKHQVAEVTSLGLVQMTRKRIGQGLVEAFSEECPTCKGRGFILHDQPTVSADYDDPYALRGGDPFVKTNKHGRGTAPAPEPAGSSADVKAKLAQIAAAAVAANNTEEE